MSEFDDDMAPDEPVEDLFGDLEVSWLRESDLVDDWQSPPAPEPTPPAAEAPAVPEPDPEPVAEPEPEPEPEQMTTFSNPTSYTDGELLKVDEPPPVHDPLPAWEPPIAYAPEAQAEPEPWPEIEASPEPDPRDWQAEYPNLAFEDDAVTAYEPEPVYEPEPYQDDVAEAHVYAPLVDEYVAPFPEEPAIARARAPKARKPPLTRKAPQEFDHRRRRSIVALAAITIAMGAALSLILILVIAAATVIIQNALG